MRRSASEKNASLRIRCETSSDASSAPEPSDSVLVALSDSVLMASILSFVSSRRRPAPRPPQCSALHRPAYVALAVTPIRSTRLRRASQSRSICRVIAIPDFWNLVRSRSVSLMAICRVEAHLDVARPHARQEVVAHPVEFDLMDADRVLRHEHTDETLARRGRPAVLVASRPAFGPGDLSKPVGAIPVAVEVPGGGLAQVQRVRGDRRPETLERGTSAALPSFPSAVPSRRTRRQTRLPARRRTARPCAGPRLPPGSPP